MNLPGSGRDRAAPRRPAGMVMTWHDLLFAHWPVPPALLRPLIPPALELDLWDGQAWIGVVPFGMSNVRKRRLPRVPGTSCFPELNVRTYVVHGDRPGVWFFSLDAASRIVVWVARRTFHLPYLHARMTLAAMSDGVSCRSRRVDRGAPPAEFIGRYRGVGAAYHTAVGQHDHWLTARYCLYSADRHARLYRGEIDHEPWHLQLAEAEIKVNSMTHGLGVRLPHRPPLLHFAKRLDVLAWSIEAV